MKKKGLSLKRTSSLVGRSGENHCRGGATETSNSGEVEANWGYDPLDWPRTLRMLEIGQKKLRPPVMQRKKRSLSFDIRKRITPPKLL